MNVLQHPGLQEEKLDDSLRLSVEIAYVTWHASFQPPLQEKSCNSAHEQTPLSNDTINSVLWHWEVGWAKELSACLIVKCSGYWQLSKALSSTSNLKYRNLVFGCSISCTLRVIVVLTWVCELEFMSFSPHDM
jgi:hypothetical protein